MCKKKCFFFPPADFSSAEVGEASWCLLLFISSDKFTFFRWTSQETHSKGWKKSFLQHYDLPLNSFTPADHHAANERTSRKRRSDRKGKKIQGKAATSFPTNHDEWNRRNNLRFSPARLREVGELSTTLPVAFLRLTLADGGGKTASVSWLIQNKRGFGGSDGVGKFTPRKYAQSDRPVCYSQKKMR